MGPWDLVKVGADTYWGFLNALSPALSWDWIDNWNLFYWIVFSVTGHFYTTWSKVRIRSLWAIITSWDKALTQNCHIRGANRVQLGTLWHKVSHVVPIQTFRCLDVSVDQLWLSRWSGAYQGVGYDWDISGFMIEANDDKTWSKPVITLALLKSRL